MLRVEQAVEENNFSLMKLKRQEKKVAFFDIETTGLSAKTASIYMIGMSCFDEEKDAFKVVQFFAEQEKDEPELINAFFNELRDISHLYHFNGSTFDIPFITKICDIYSMELPEHVKKLFKEENTDLYRKFKCLKDMFGLENSKQKTLEACLGLKREDAYTGEELIKVYKKYLVCKDDNEKKELEKTLLLHNFCDLDGMLFLTRAFAYTDLLSEMDFESFSNEYSVKESEKAGESLIIKLSASSQFFYKNAILSTHNDIKVWFMEKEIVVEIPIFSGQFNFYFDNYKDYYYIPAEDRVYHKSLAQFIGKNNKEKAKPDNCYASLEGLFIPAPVKVCKNNNFEGMKLFKEEYNDKTGYFCMQDLKDDECIKKYVYYLMRTLK